MPSTVLTFTHFASLTLNMSRLLSTARILCPGCGFVFKHSRSLMQHLKMSFTCNLAFEQMTHQNDKYNFRGNTGDFSVNGNESDHDIDQLVLDMSSSQALGDKRTFDSTLLALKAGCFSDAASHLVHHNKRVRKFTEDARRKKEDKALLQNQRSSAGMVIIVILTPLRKSHHLSIVALHT